MKEIRNSNHEIMRIISMFMIVLGHILLFGGLLESSNQNVRYVCNLIEFILIVHVNSYILVSGYYQSNSSFKKAKLWKIINASWFYRIVIMLAFLTLGLISIPKLQFIKDIFPIMLKDYWYVKLYILLYCLSPFINKMIDSFNKYEYQMFLFVCFIIISIIPTLTGGEFFENSGYTLYNFIYLYTIGAYLRKYPLEESYIFRKFSPTLYRVVLIILFFTCVLLNNSIFYFGKQLSGINELFQLMSDNISKFSIAYSNPIIIIQSITYFSFFTTIKFKSKFINKCSGLMLGVFLIHGNNYVHQYLYDWIGIANRTSESVYIVIKAIIMAFLVFFICTVIEFIRQYLFNMISKAKILIKAKKIL